MKSPVTGGNRLELITTFPTESIIKIYEDELKVDTRRFFKGVPAVELYECRDTGYRFYYPEGILGDGQFYADLNKDDVGYYSTTRWEHTYATSLIKPGQKVLEIGAGDGFFLEQLKKSNIDAIGLELNVAAIAKGEKKGLRMYNEMIEDHADGHVGEYDVVCCFQVLEHIYNVKSFLDASLKALKRGGKLIIGVPNNNPYLFKQDKWHTLNLPPHHAGLWNKRAFTELQKFYDVTPQDIIVEPLSNNKSFARRWYLAQRNYYKEKKSFLGGLISIIPAPIGKMVVKLFSPWIDGFNIVAVFTKN
ncbi:class I SAM-dependent methyltransferase [Chitinophaga pinensis]|uniref:Methyltransferase type 12 n=1 Tax=Chitinophaga pinensis (strain ATCC 43595 / DSM 2588 / LMG 13176 / NBRC 15968 / NCIMB 11800 / UQM 2034) TaxID=485918 RepID=A0A979G920_CHIPD|nr:class I SAM-dependent methyltransferase [Chitinophaga pinensis]ACU63194.1 Methyltransferase type 12 [Chitinophaga pinensis DSM 2588]